MGKIHIGFIKDETDNVRRVIDDSPKSALLLGTSRVGKGTDVLIPTAMDFDGALVGVDPKLEISPVVRDARKLLGKFFVINPYGLHAHIPELQTAYFNPFANIPKDPEAVNAIADVIAGAVIMQTGPDPYFSMGARSYFIGEAEDMLLRWSQPRQPSLVDLRRRFMLEGEERIKHMFEVYEYTPSENAREIASIYKEAEPDKGSMSQRGDAKTQLTGLLRSHAIARVLAGNPAKTGASDFTFEQLNSAADTVMMGMPSKQAADNPRFARLFIACAMNAFLREGRTLEKLFLCDETANSLQGELPILETAINTGAGYGLRCLLTFQSWEHVLDCFPKRANALASGCAVEMYLSINDMVTARRVEERGGQIERVFFKHSSGWSIGADGKSSRSAGYAEETEKIPLFDKVSLFGMAENASIVFKEGMAEPLIVHRLPYYHGAMFPQSAHWPKLARLNPYAPGYHPSLEAPAGEHLT